MHDYFRACLAETLRWEGGYSDHPDDPGGPTMAGIIQRVYDAWRDNMGLPRRPVRDSEPHEREAIYRQQYWLAVRGDELPPGVNLAVFDFGVNSGPGRAVKALQRALGLTPDGAIGAITIRAAWDAEGEGRTADIVAAVMAERRRFIRQIRTYGSFGRGWERRCDGIEAAALRLSPSEPSVPAMPRTIEVPLPLPDPDAQSASQGRAPVDTRPSRAGVLARVKGWLLAALGFGAVTEQAAEVLPALDANQALGLWDRAAPILTRLVTSPGGQIALAIMVVGVVAVLLGRSFDHAQEQN